MSIEKAKLVDKQCTHCGDSCLDQHVVFMFKDFCCQGCANVYGLLLDNGLGGYYTLNEIPGKSIKQDKFTQYEYLDDEKVVNKLLEFREGNLCKIRINLPDIHCSSCIYLLENLHRIESNIKSVRVDFIKKEATIIYENIENFTLRKLFELLSKIGYLPNVSLQSLDNVINKSKPKDRSLIYQLGLAGFVFGNVMLLSFPEYLGFTDARSSFFLGYINLVLATPLLFYGASRFLISAYKAVSTKMLNIDVPLAIGIITLYLRSFIEIISGSGEGYLDSFAGLIFFLLIGRYIQDLTHKAIDFERNYRSYFPISVLVKKEDSFRTVPIDEIVENDVLFVRSEEIVPVDGFIVEGEAMIDYSFVTGESDVVVKPMGEKIFAGGREKGQGFYVKALTKVDQSKLTKLWQEDIFQINEVSKNPRLLDIFGAYFTYIILSISIFTGIYWFAFDYSKFWFSITAVLIIACPCAISMAPPFTYSNIMRLLAKNRFFLKNMQSIESFQNINHIVFDKTGTITSSSEFTVSYEGKFLDPMQISIIKSACTLSSHPLSKSIYKYLNDGNEALKVSNFINHLGKGISAKISNTKVRLGSADFIFGSAQTNEVESKVFVELNGIYFGCFSVLQQYRNGLSSIFKDLKENGYPITVLTGDSSRDDSRLRSILGLDAEILYQQMPIDKLEFIKKLQNSGKKVLMVGDGLNDAGALRQSNAGIVISEDSNNFTPACDGILDGKRFENLPVYLGMLKKTKSLIYGALLLAVLYNIVGLSFAVTGNLSPVVAAILMPLSSVTIIAYALSSSWILFYYFKKRHSKYLK